ncbi:hypothetical protein BJV82DRAFT_576150 [Fennellomyces sp. T-0311]|nr:hypothetical protein BJV82DRAFT_576150 [Fennellomyces sp. T-0311]
MRDFCSKMILFRPVQLPVLVRELKASQSYGARSMERTVDTGAEEDGEALPPYQLVLTTIILNWGVLLCLAIPLLASKIHALVELVGGLEARQKKSPFFRHFVSRNL